MKTDEQVIEIAAGNSASYSARIEALDEISDLSVFKFLAINAKDDWIKLESAVRGKITSVLHEMKNHSDDRISLEASIELDDQHRLAEIVLNCKDDLIKDIAINYIDDDVLLKTIIQNSKNEKERASAVLRLGNIPLIREILTELSNEDLRLKLAQFLSDYKAISELAETAKDKRVQKTARNWLEGLSAEAN